MTTHQDRWREKVSDMSDLELLNQAALLDKKIEILKSKETLSPIGKLQLTNRREYHHIVNAEIDKRCEAMLPVKRGK